MCHSFGFYRPVTPIVFTSDGKYIGGLEHFKEHVTGSQLRRLYRLESDLKKPERMSRAALDLELSESQKLSQSQGPSLLSRIQKRTREIRDDGQIQIIDGEFEHVVEAGLEVSSRQFYVKRSQLLTPTNEDLAGLFGKELPFVRAPELLFDLESSEGIDPSLDIMKDELRDGSASPTKESKDISKESQSQDVSRSEESPDLSMEPNTAKSPGEGSDQDGEEQEAEQPVIDDSASDVNDSLLVYQLTDFNLKDFINRFQGFLKKKEPHKVDPLVPVPKTMKTVCIPDSFVVEPISDNFILAAHPFPMVPGQLFVFPGEHTDQEGRWLVRDISMTPNWLKLVAIPPQRPVYQDGILIDPVPPPEVIMVKGHSGNLLASRGYTTAGMELLMASRNSSLKLNTIKVTINHILTEQDWAVWFPLIRHTEAIGFFQWLPYGCKKYLFTQLPPTDRGLSESSHPSVGRDTGTDPTAEAGGDSGEGGGRFHAGGTGL